MIGILLEVRFMIDGRRTQKQEPFIVQKWNDRAFEQVSELIFLMEIVELLYSFSNKNITWVFAIHYDI
jgi:hypothetical protein